MLLRYFYDHALAHASYLVGCQKSKTAIVIDPGRDIEQYLETARQEQLAVVAVAETHIHADYVSGARELADRVAAKLYVSDAGPAEWKYQYLDDYPHQLLRDGDSFSLGKIRFDVLHTPGHTPESLSFLLTDEGGGANEPMGIFTGDFVFVGSIGRPDLLEQAAGIMNTAEPGARDLFRSIARFKQLPEHLQVWPAHGAGSACGKGLGAIPSSTVGYEKRFNPALQILSEEEFVRYILDDQPEAPTYFGVMKRVNKVGPKVLGPESTPAPLSLEQLPAAIATGNVVDLSARDLFRDNHVPGSINIPLGMLAAWAGWLLDYNRPTALNASPQQLQEAIRVLHKIGVDDITGYFDAREVRPSELTTQSYQSLPPVELAQAIARDEVTLIDVRSDAEWNAGHIPQARHHFLGKLQRQIDQLPTDQPVVVHCQSGARSAVAASVLQRAGIHVIDLAGGMNAWMKADLPTT